MFTESEAKAAILAAMGAIDWIRHRIDQFKKVMPRTCGTVGLVEALAEAEGIRAVAVAVHEHTLDILCGGLPTMELKLDVARDRHRSGEQLCRAEWVVALVAEMLLSVAGDAANEALRTRQQADIDRAIDLLDRVRIAFDAIARRETEGLIKMPKLWAHACAEEIAALRMLETREAA